MNAGYKNLILEAGIGLGLLLIMGWTALLIFAERYYATVFIPTRFTQEPIIHLPEIPRLPEPIAVPAPEQIVEKPKATVKPLPQPIVERAQAQPSTYPIHADIKATFFWVGEAASKDNGFIANDISAWDEDWVAHFGGVDDPDNRAGYHPAAFSPKENPFYVALPYGDYTGSGPKENVTGIPWYQPFEEGKSLLKNRWIKIIANERTVYGQWEDVGPYETDDIEYVFGESRPKEKVGIDVSPAIRDYLGFDGMTTVSWQFVEEGDVPAGPWKEIVTTSGPSWK